MNSSILSSAGAPIDLLAENDLFSPRIRVGVLRLDLLHPEISGNKWFKLQGYVDEAVASGKRGLISFGGAWSNHLVALGASGTAAGLKTTGIVRGEEPKQYSASLIRMLELGMTLRFTDRQSYHRLQKQESMESLQLEYPDAVIIPEGGRGETGRTGAAKIAMIDGINQFSHCCLAVGTGTTIAGMAMGVSGDQELTGIPVLKGTTGYEPIPPGWITGKRIRLVHGFDHGGYAKHSPPLLDFMNHFYDRFGIPSDFVYTGKLFFAIARLSINGYFPSGSRVLMIHSGGMQGNLSLPAHRLHF